VLEVDESRTSRKRGTQRPETARSSPPGGAEEPRPARGYARGRAKDEAARRALKPLRPGERPTAVTVGAIAAALLALANVIATIAGWDGATGSDDSQALLGSLLVAAVLALVAYGMWKGRYWAVLGMQTLLAITIIFACLGLITATSIGAALLLALIIAAAGTLFWFLVKSMARIQMPERPGSSGQ
jgi:hypothetical protein